MKTKAFTLIELTVVMAVVLALAGGSLYVANGYQNYNRGVEAGQLLKSVYAAQREFLADNPTTDVGRDFAGVLDANTIRDYLPRNSNFFVDPTATPLVPRVLSFEDLEGNTRNVVFSVPPRYAGRYDPSERIDGVWDAGQ